MKSALYCFRRMRFAPLLALLAISAAWVFCPDAPARPSAREGGDRVGKVTEAEGGRKRLRIFPRRQRGAPEPAVKEEASPGERGVPAEGDDAEKGEKRRGRLFGGLFGRDDDAPGDGAATELPVGKKEVASKVEKKRLDEVAPEARAENPREEAGGLGSGLFGLFRSDKRPDPVSGRDLGIGEKYVVSGDKIPFYSVGPNQPMPPDQILASGQLVTMRKAGWGWSDIELPDGQMGVVATKSLRKATQKDLGGRYASRRGRSSSKLWKVLDFNDAPEPELPSDSGGIPLGVGLLPPLDDD